LNRNFLLNLENGLLYTRPAGSRHVKRYSIGVCVIASRDAKE
jgi:hypothetical protein